MYIISVKREQKRKFPRVERVSLMSSRYMGNFVNMNELNAAIVENAPSCILGSMLRKSINQDKLREYARQMNLFKYATEYLKSVPTDTLLNSYGLAEGLIDYYENTTCEYLKEGFDRYSVANVFSMLRNDVSRFTIPMLVESGVIEELEQRTSKDEHHKEYVVPVKKAALLHLATNAHVYRVR